MSTKWFVIISGVLSTLASGIGGYLMYTGGLATLEGTVEELGRADAQAMHREAVRTFDVVHGYQMKYKELMLRYGHFTSRGEFADWVRSLAVADLYHDDVLWAVGIRGMHPTDPMRDLVEYLWIDPLQEGQDYVVGRYHPGVNTTVCRAPCHMTHLLDPSTAGLVSNIYNYTNVDFPDYFLRMVSDNNIQPGTAWWGNPVLWFSRDNTSYVYFEHNMLMPPADHGYFKDIILLVGTVLSTYPFENFMLQHITDAGMVLTQTDKGIDSFILAANFPEGRLDHTCRNAHVLNKTAYPCIKTLRDLTLVQRDVILSLNNTADWVFGENHGHWTIRATVFAPGKHDYLRSVHLMWFRPVSKLQDEMSRSLYLFIGFLLAVVVFDIAIATAEITLVARPLIRLAAATRPLRTMQLDEAEAEVLVACSKHTFIDEVKEMQNGLLFAIRSLRNYKCFMPTTLFPPNPVDLEEEEDDTEEEEPPGDTPYALTVAKAGVSTTLGLVSGKYSAVLVGLSVAERERSVPDASIYTLLEQKVKLTGGQLHGFTAVHFDTLFVTWSRPRRNPLAVRFSFAVSDLEGAVVALATGSSWTAGNVGTSTYRAFAMEGRQTESLLKCFAFANYAGGMGVGAVITTMGCAEKFTSHAVAQAVGQVLHNGEAMYVAEVFDFESDESCEWMYEGEGGLHAVPLINMLCNEVLDITQLPEFSPLTTQLKRAASTAPYPADIYTVHYAPHRYSTSSGRVV